MRLINTRCLILTALGLLLAGLAPAAEGLSDEGALIDALRKGGCYIVMRHASSPRTPPAPGSEVPGNATRERQLDAQGRETARAMGESFRRLGIPVGSVLSSPTWRAQETVQEAKLPRPTLVEELGDGGQSMSATNDAQADWLRRRVGQPVRGDNIMVVSHQPNLRSAFPEHAANLADGEAMILRPAPDGSITLLRRVRIEEWPSFRATAPR